MVPHRVVLISQLAWDEDVHTTEVWCLPGILGEVCRWEWTPTDRGETVPPKILQLILQNLFWSFALKTTGDQKCLALGQNAEVIVLLLAVRLYFQSQGEIGSDL